MGLILRQTTTPNSGTTLSVKGSTLTYAEADGNFTYLMTNMSGSRISITGPTSVTGSLTISGGITGSFSGSLAGTIAYTQGGNSFGANSTIGLNDNYSLSINAGTSTRLFVSASGNIGIATTTPNRLLTLSGSSTAYAAFNSSTYDNYSIGASSLGFLIYDDTDSAYRMAISRSSATISQVSIFSDAPSFNNSYNASLYIGNFQSNIATNGKAMGYRLLTSNAGSDVDSIFNIQYAAMDGTATPPNSYSSILSLTKAGNATFEGYVYAKDASTTIQSGDSSGTTGTLNILSNRNTYSAGSGYDASIYIGAKRQDIVADDKISGYRLLVSNTAGANHSILSIQGATGSGASSALPSNYATLVNITATGVIITGSLTTTAGAKLGNAITDTHTITGSLSTSGSVTINNILTLTVRSTTPASQPTGSIICSGSGVDNHLYYYNGSAWRQLDN
jgi:hypothetical protein